MGQVTLTNLCKSYGANAVIRGVDLDVRDGEFMVFVGPSGCGKSTTLRMIAGLESITDGELRIGGQRANEMHPSQRGAAMVFQSYALYPHMTVRQNMGFSLKMAGKAKAAVTTQVDHVAEILKITHLLERYPKDLSGGQRQRVAIGRAIVRKPSVFLFDEPLSNLDAELRVSMRIELTKLHLELGTTMIYVTHDQVEAMTMGQRIAVFNQGRIEQVGAPLDLYHRPANLFVAGFLGTPRINLIPRPSENASPDYVAFWKMLTKADADEQAQTLGIRAEHIAIAPAGQGVRTTVALIEHLGDICIGYLKLDGLDALLHIKSPSRDLDNLTKGMALNITAQPDAVMTFNALGQRISA